MIACPIPKTAPFAEDEIDLLNRVVGRASLSQRAWLAGFLAGLDAAAAPAAPSEVQHPAEPLTIVYATESGNAERLAGDMARAARKSGMKPVVVDMADLDLALLPKARRLVVIASTWGEGEPPPRASAVYAELMSENAPRLDGVEYGVLALGDRAYAGFCSVGKALDQRLSALGGRRAVERVDCDLDFADPAAKWIQTTLVLLSPRDASARGTVISIDFAARQQDTAELRRVEAEVITHINLNSSRSDKETVHLELALEPPALNYKPGDSLEIFAHNDPALVDELLAVTGLQSDDGLRARLTNGRDITTLSPATLQSFFAATGHREVKALIDSDASSFVAGRQLIDLVRAFPAALSAEQLEGMTRPLAPRAYSIASSRREVGDEAHLLVAAVRYESRGRARTGVASGYVTDRLRKGDRLQVRLRPNKHFALPGPDTDIIMVGPGTGVAPFRAFIQDRRATGAGGRNWLFFGDRRFTHDFLYQLEWQEALRDGVLTRIDLAFSRDAPRKVYVQDRIWEARRDVVDWLDRGAALFVCGDAKAMAKDVRATLVRAIADVRNIAPGAAEASVRELEKHRRYLQDVY